jgi:hypothetical protein
MVFSNKPYSSYGVCFCKKKAKTVVKKEKILYEVKEMGLNKTLYLLLVNLLIVFLGIGLVNPVMPTLKHEMNINAK